MNTLSIKSCKHQNNVITFTKDSNSLFVEGIGKDSWTQNDTVIGKTPLDSVNIKLSQGRGDNDITITLQTVEKNISSVLGSPGNSGDKYNSRDTYLFFNEIFSGKGSLHDTLIRILD